MAKLLHKRAANCKSKIYMKRAATFHPGQAEKKTCQQNSIGTKCRAVMKNIGKNRRFFFQKKPKKKEGNLLKFHWIMQLFLTILIQRLIWKSIVIPSLIRTGPFRYLILLYYKIFELSLEENQAKNFKLSRPELWDHCTYGCIYTLKGSTLPFVVSKYY